MALYQPRNLIPYLQCIDATQDNIFSCQIDGTKCVGFTLQILTMDNEIVYGEDMGEWMLDTPLYNGDILEWTIPANTLTNGVDYKWRIRLYQENPTMMVGYGTVTGSNPGSIAIYPPTDAEKETIMSVKQLHLRINNVTRPVERYDSTLNRFTLTTKFNWTTIANNTQVQVLDSNANGEPNNVIYTGSCVNSTISSVCMRPNIYAQTHQVIKINGTQRTIATFDSDTWVANVVPNLDSIPTWGTEYEVYSDFIDSNPEVPFFARSNAIITITNISEDQVINNKSYDFIGSYTQIENAEMKYYKWKLWVINESNNAELIKETEDIYSANIHFNFNEFRNGIHYRIQLFVEDEYDRYFASTPVNFSIAYANPEVDVKPMATFLPDKTAINVLWGNSAEYEPVISLYYTKYFYSDNTYTRSDIPGRVFDLTTNQLVSATVNPNAQLRITMDIREHSIINNMPFTGVRSLYFPHPETITWSDWTKEDRVGVMDLPEDFCVSWYQNFDEDFSGDIINITREDDNEVEHVYRVWVPEETDLENKYKFMYDLDGTTGEYVWDSAAQDFCLQYSININKQHDYVYGDTLNSETQYWEDAKYFVENGTRGKKLHKFWWKFIMTKNTLTVQKGSD